MVRINDITKRLQLTICKLVCLCNVLILNRMIEFGKFLNKSDFFISEKFWNFVELKLACSIKCYFISYDLFVCIFRSY